MTFGANRRERTLKSPVGLKSFTYEFEELPLVMSSGHEACQVSGLAEIAYDLAGAWSIARIGFVGVQRVNPTFEQQLEARRSGQPIKFFERRDVWLDTGDPIQMIIYHRLEHEWRSRVDDQVHDRIFGDRNGGDDLECRSDHAVALERERV